MSYKVYSRAGGAPAASMTDITARVPAFDEVTPVIQMGMSAQDGASSQGTMIIPDPVGNIDDSLYFPPHTLIRWTEDATGDELWLAQGRVTSYEIGRADVKAADNVQWNLTVLDANIDLRGLAFTAPWVRPTETGTARLYALSTYTLDGTASTRPDYNGDITYRPSTDITISASHLAPNSNTVLMPAKTYKVGTQPVEVIDDCAQMEGKTWGVVAHHSGGSSHLCLLYVRETDHSTYASTVKISDRIADWDPDDPTDPVFEPHWDQGFGQVVDGTGNVSGLVSIYGTEDGFVPVLDTTSADANEYWLESYYDSESETATQAADRASSLLAYRKPPTETNRVSIEMQATQHSLITAGMSIQVKATPINAGNDSSVGTYLDRRIVSLQWEPIADGRYRAIMLLNRGIRKPGFGHVQPASTSPAPAPGNGCIDTFSRSINPGAWGEGEWNLPWEIEIDPGTGSGDPDLDLARFSVDGNYGLYDGRSVFGGIVDNAGTEVVARVGNPDWVVGTEAQIYGTVFDGGSYAEQFDVYWTPGNNCVPHITTDDFVCWFTCGYGAWTVYFYASANNPTAGIATWEAWLSTDPSTTTNAYVIAGNPGPDATILNTWTTIMSTASGKYCLGITVAYDPMLLMDSPDMNYGCSIRVEATTVVARAWGPAGSTSAAAVTVSDTTADPQGITFNPRLLASSAVIGVDQVIVSGGNCGGSSGYFALLDDPRFGEIPTEYDLGLGDGSTTVYFVPVSPYVPGSLRVWVDGLEQTAAITESDPATGEFTFSFAPEATEQIKVWYQVAP